MAENPVGHFPDDFGIFDGGAFADWKSILYSGRNRNRVLDALPIFGAGTALVPWSLFLLFKREWGHALILFGLYLLCYFLREFTEAHLMGKKMGLSPLETLAAIYVGLQLFSLFGFLLGPIGLLIIKDFVEEYGEADEGAAAH